MYANLTLVTVLKDKKGMGGELAPGLALGHRMGGELAPGLALGHRIGGELAPRLALGHRMGGGRMMVGRRKSVLFV